MSHQILVVEDHYPARQNIIDSLEDEGYGVHGAESVDEALKLATKNKYDLLITDIRLPNDTDGIEGFYLLKRRIPDLRCIVITGYADPDPVHRAIKKEVDDWLCKPFEDEELVSVTNRVLAPNKFFSQYTSSVSKLPGKFISAAASLFGRDPTSLVAKQHHKVFRALYTAMKSTLINHTTANELYSRLNKLEPNYLSCMSNTQEKLAKELIAEYNEILEDVGKFSNSKLSSIKEGSVDRTHFLHLYNAVKDNKVTPEEFEMTPNLRASKKEVFTETPDLLKLRRICWGEIA